MNKLMVLALLVFAAAVPAVATREQDAVFDAVAAAFSCSVDRGHISPLKSMQARCALRPA
jgi:hypothetical protein